MAAPWKNAASIIIISKTTRRVLMMRRGSTAKFMPNALVFPGGVVTSSDEKIGDPLPVAALREVFEETGLLITSSGVESAVNNKELSHLQEAIKKDASLFKNIFSEGATNKLTQWSCWLTPTSIPRRYLTDFFILPIDGEPEIRMCEQEMTDYSWNTPDTFLKKAFDGEVILPPPQLYELSKLKSMKSIKPIGDPKAVICPQTIKWSDKTKLTNVMPGDHLYIEEDSYHQETRVMDPHEVEVKADKPTHRVEYLPKPVWGKISLFHHNLLPPYNTIFPTFL